MIKKLEEKIGYYKNKRVMVSFISYSSNSYEVGVFSLNENFKELDMYSASTYEDGKIYYDKCVSKYILKKKTLKEQGKIPERYIKFADAYNKVYNSCYKEFSNRNPEDDGGTSNFDTPTVFIGTRLSEHLLKAALKPYNLPISVSKNTIFCTIPYIQYQGFLRTEQAQYMCQSFQTLGYDSSVYYSID